MTENAKRPSRRAALVGVGGGLGVAGLSKASETLAQSAGVHDFAFLNGDWRVRHRKLQRRLVGDANWLEFDGTCRAWELMDGAANVDDNVLNDPAGAYRAASLRRYDPASDLWSIWWADGRSPGLEPPVRGRFRRGVGTFEGDDLLNGRPIRVRFEWSGITATHARWQQAFSPDGGASWEINWAMNFERVP